MMTHNTNSRTNFKTSMLKSSLCDYSDSNMLVSETITAAPQAGDNRNNADKEVVLKSCAPFTDCINEINNTQIDNTKDIDVAMPVYTLIEYSDNYLKKSGSLWQYYRDGLALTNAGAITNFCASNKNNR